LISIFPLIFFASVAVKNISSAEGLVRLGNEAANQFNAEKALSYYEKAAIQDPSLYEAALNYLRTRNSMGQQLLYGDKKTAEAREIFLDNYERAKKLYEKFPLKTESPFAIAVTAGNLALLSAPREKVFLALNVEKNLKESLRINPKFAYGFLGLGIFYKEISKITFIERFFAELFFGKVPHATLEDAELNLRKALKLDPSFIFTRFHLADCLYKMDREEEAIEMYKELVTMRSIDLNDDLWKTLSTEFLKDHDVSTTQ
jgi:tetratricopeptide (TPR) repeat protein